MLRAWRLLAWCAVGPLFLYLWWRGRREPAYRQRWAERLGRGAVPAQQRHGVLLHCASVGEVIAARGLVHQLLADPHWGPVTISCTTPTGARQIAADHGDRVLQRYFPIDTPGATRRFLQALQPRLVLLMERELWPEFLHQAQWQGLPVALVNARLSERSAQGYRRWVRLVGPALRSLRLVLAEDAASAQRLQALGVSPQRLQITGNLKSDVQAGPALRQAIAARRAAIGARPVLTAGSTHAGEDEALLAAFQRHLATEPDSLLVLVPRHPERFAPVAALLAASGLRTARLGDGEPAWSDTQVLLIDRMGELMLWYGVAEACFIGGSLVPRQGHNPLEALCLDKPLLTGPHTANFATVFQALEDADALLRVADADAVFTQWHALRADPAACSARVARGRTVHQALTGALQRTLDSLHPLVAPFDLQAGAPPRVHQAGGSTVWADGALFAEASPALFDPEHWRQRGSVQRLDGGRGQVHRVADARGRYLLRHYYRGGLMARVSRDVFLHRPVPASRAMQEMQLLGALRRHALPVPHAAAARYQRAGLGYRADILVQEIPQATDIARLMHRERSLSDAEWQALGRVVRRLHDAQCFHSDLNCHNLLLDAQGGAWIVDFDKCGFRPGDDWKAANLQRLLRSLRKELRLDPSFRWNDSRWAIFTTAYEADPRSALAPTASLP
jgi:3-deoxy-D-manno-octulosonic-acid transferase